ncbi:hypothetical protein EVAR_78129_1 [Eumeta japonica]|uniref:Uncharacterized protein n=1 Tax=Eumeta variegata TaxID=151549 RepID=A0A4C1T1C8_EUMVA|nr:hypothetical protein EVAR_78129_1 [Eumeta japonica]
MSTRAEPRAKADNPIKIRLIEYGASGPNYLRICKQAQTKRSDLEHHSAQRLRDNFRLPKIGKFDVSHCFEKFAYAVVSWESPFSVVGSSLEKTDISLTCFLTEKRNGGRSKPTRDTRVCTLRTIVLEHIQ